MHRSSRGQFASVRYGGLLFVVSLFYANLSIAGIVNTLDKPNAWDLWLPSESADAPGGPLLRRPHFTRHSLRTWADPWKQQPSLAWTELTLSLITKYQQNPLRAVRNLTYVHAAMHDAIAVAARAKLNANAQKLALHAAASGILEYLYPQEPMGRFGALGHAAILTVSTNNEDIDTRAARIGHAVTLNAIARASNDGAALVWDLRNRPPAQAGGWQAAPPLNIHKPLEPTAGKWRTWALKSGDEIKPPPPVPYDSAEYWQEVKQVLEVTEQLTPAQKEIAERWNLGHGTVTPAGVWNLETKKFVTQYKLDFADTVRVYAALNAAMMDAFIACWNVKFTHWTQRPVSAIRAKLNPDFMPHLVTPPFPSYVSGHSTASGAASEVLSAFFPKDAKTFRAMAREAAISRLYGGIHFASDNNEGLRLGQQIGQRTLQRLKRH